MAKLQRSVQKQNLENVRVLIDDTDPSSRFFRIKEIRDVLHGGRQGFLIQGAKELVNETEVLIELLDINGDPIFVTTIRNFAEGRARFVSIEVYEDTPVGPATLTILGEAATFADGSEIPDVWKGVFNVKWQKSLTVNPMRTNDAKIRVFETPTLVVKEVLTPFRKTVTSSFLTVTGSGTRANANTAIINTSVNVPNIYTVTTLGTPISKSMEGGTFTASIDGVTGSAPGVGSTIFSSSIVKVFNDSTFQIDPPLISDDGTRFSPFKNVTNYTISFQESPTFSNTTLSRSFADVELARLKTFSGDIARTKFLVRSAESEAGFEFVGDVRLDALELTVTNSIELGPKTRMGNFFTQSVIDAFWVGGVIVESSQPPYVTGSSVTLARDTTRLIDSMHISFPNLSLPTGSGPTHFMALTRSVLIGPSGETNDVTLDFIKGLEYSFAADVLCRKAFDSFEGKMDVYLSGSAFPSTSNLGTLIASYDCPVGEIQRLRSRESSITNFIAKQTGTAKLVLVIHQGDWHVSDLSIFSAIETGFNPDCASFLIPVLDKRFEQLQFKAQLFDPNNNEFPQEILSDFVFFDGGNIILKGTDNRIEGTLTIAPSGSQAVMLSSEGFLDEDGTPISGSVMAVTNEVTPKFFSVDTPFLVGSDPIGNFKLSMGNKLKAFINSGSGDFVLEIQGTVSASVGAIGGWTLSTGSLFSGNVKIESFAERILMGDATSPVLGTGIFLGRDGGDYEFRAGDPLGRRMHWDGTDLFISGSIITTPAIGTSPTVLGWTHDLVFSSTDNDTVAWSTGSIVLGSGETFSIASGNTGNITALTYIYLDTDASTTVLQTTTTASTSIGANKILIAVAENVADVAKDAEYVVYGGSGAVGVSKTILAGVIAANTITANEIAANTITAAEISASSITATELNVTTLSAISADMGTLTAGTIIVGSMSITAATERILFGSASAPLTGTGIFLGKDGVDYEFRVGDPSGNHMHWDGTDLIVTGARITAPSAGSSPSILGWINSMVFSATDNDTVAWSTGSIALSDGTTYTIVAGNTGNMVATTYIYLDTDVSTTVLQTTTTVATAIGTNKLLVAVAEDSISGTNATFLVFGGSGVGAVIDLGSQVAGSLTAAFAAAGLINSNVTINADGSLTGAGGGQASLTSLPGSIQVGSIAVNAVTAGTIAALSITASQIVANTITANEIAVGTITANEIFANTITANEIAANTITAAQVDTMILTAKNLVADTGSIGGWILGSNTLSSLNISINSNTEQMLFGDASAFQTGIGIFIGLDSGLHKFRIGDPNGSQLYWNGSNVIVESDIRMIGVASIDFYDGAPGSLQGSILGIVGGGLAITGPIHPTFGIHLNIGQEISFNDDGNNDTAIAGNDSLMTFDVGGFLAFNLRPGSLGGPEMAAGRRFVTGGDANTYITTPTPEHIVFVSGNSEIWRMKRGGTPTHVLTTPVGNEVLRLVGLIAGDVQLNFYQTSTLRSSIVLDDTNNRFLIQSYHGPIRLSPGLSGTTGHKVEITRASTSQGRMILTDAQLVVQEFSQTDTADAVNWDEGNICIMNNNTSSGARALTYLNMQNGGSYRIIVVRGAGATANWNWATAGSVVEWSGGGGEEPVMSTATGLTDLIDLMKVNGVIYGTFSVGHTT